MDPLESYLVQFRFEENVGDWKFCSNQSIGHNSTIVVDNLNPYTKYRVSRSLTDQVMIILVICVCLVSLSTCLVPGGAAIVAAARRVLDVGGERGD